MTSIIHAGPALNRTDPPDTIKYKKLHKDATLPVRSDPGAVGLDVSAFLISERGTSVNFILPPNNTRMVRTGLVLLPPVGYFLSVCSRSGLAKDSIFIANAPGIIDPNFTGELQILLYNGGHTTVYLKHGDRIAQVICLPLPEYFGLQEIDSLPTTSRGDRGFGSSGTKPIPPKD